MLGNDQKSKRITPEARIIGRNLRFLRDRAGLSQQLVGRVLSISFQQVQKYEKGRNRVPAEKLYLLKHLYDVPYDHFFVGLEHLLERIYEEGL